MMKLFLCVIAFVCSFAVFSNAASSTLPDPVICPLAPTSDLWAISSVCDTGAAAEDTSCLAVCDDWLNTEYVTFSVLCVADTTTEDPTDGVWVATSEVVGGSVAEPVPLEDLVTGVCPEKVVEEPATSNGGATTPVVEEDEEPATVVVKVEITFDVELVTELEKEAVYNTILTSIEDNLPTEELAALEAAGEDISDYVQIFFNGVLQMFAEGETIVTVLFTQRVAETTDATTGEVVVDEEAVAFNEDLVTAFVEAVSDPEGTLQQSAYISPESAAAITVSIEEQCWDGTVPSQNVDGVCPAEIAAPDDDGFANGDGVWAALILIMLAFLFIFGGYAYYKHQEKSDKFDDVDIELTTNNHRAPSNMGAVPVPNFQDGGEEQAFDESESVHITIG